jgi:methanesulfonate monooxygenase small subunit
VSAAAVEQARELVARSCLLLDEERFDDYLGLYADDCRYRITTYSPDLRKDMAMLDLDRKDLAVLLGNLPKHIRMSGRFMRHPSGSCAEPASGSGRISVLTTVLVAHTDLEGISRIFATGRYRDLIEVSGDAPRLLEREVRVDTRQFGPGSHVPL